MVPPGLVLLAARLANVGNEFLSKIVVVAKLAGVVVVVAAAGDCDSAGLVELNSNFGNVVLGFGVVPNENGLVEVLGAALVTVEAVEEEIDEVV